MWSNAALRMSSLRIRIGTQGRRRLRLCIPFSLFAFADLLDAWEDLALLIQHSEAAGRLAARHLPSRVAGEENIVALCKQLVLALAQDTPYDLVDIATRKDGHDVAVRIHIA